MSESSSFLRNANSYLRQAEQGLTRSQEQAAVLHELSTHHGSELSEKATSALAKAFSDLIALSTELARPNIAQDFFIYWRDASQRYILTLDTLCQRGNACIERETQGFRPVLAFDYEIVVDGRTLARPVNYALVRIVPPEGFKQTGADRRPWVIIDPRAGHGSGIGGFKAESEVGEALADGHPVYFVIFFHEPEPGQTLSDICAAEAAFLRAIQDLHPNSPKPLVTGNCQGGWAAMILAATHPQLMGPVVIAGAPLSYWAGQRGRNPFRYLAGLEGGAVPALLSSDLGAGKFDGASLVLNFEQLNPGKSWWRKNYDIFAKVDSDADRYLEFERWWSGFYFMNEAEIRWIVENLFIGNKLTRGQAVLDDGTRVDLTEIEAPVVVFASHGDNITPPQQALNWIADLYDSVQDLRARGHVIIYTLHDSIGHLGIFVSAQVASKQHKQITSVVKTIEALAPGLYEMLIDEGNGAPTVSFEARTIDDIVALGDDREDERKFEAVAHLSEWAVKTYELTAQPIIRSLITPDLAETLRRLHPLRQQYYFFSENNPLFANIRSLAEATRDARVPAGEDNPFRQLETVCAHTVEQGFNLYRDMRDAWFEIAFHSLYATPWMMQLGAAHHRHRAEHDLNSLPQVQEAIQKARLGGYKEAIVRMLILLARARGSVRRERLERSNRLLHARAPFDTMTQEQRAHLIHEQSMVVEFADEEAITALPVLLRDDVDRFRAVNLVFDIVGPVEDMDAATIAMFKRLQSTLFTLAKDWHEPLSGAGHVTPTAEAANGRLAQR